MRFKAYGIETRFGIGLRRSWVALPALVACAVACLAAGRGAPAYSRSMADDPSPITLANPRIVVLKSARLLHLFDGPRLVRTYPVDLGRQPYGTKRLGLDQKTPEGQFRIVSKNAQSPYHRFLGFDFPGEDAIASGLAQGLISEGEARALRSAHELGQRPNWMTNLGGGVGIHGRRKGGDWTGGCLALADQHVEELFEVLRIGDPVEILP